MTKKIPIVIAVVVVATVMSDEIPSTPPSSSQRQSSATGDADVAASAAAAASNVQFPYRLHELLDEVDPSIITWLPDTQAFKVLDKQTFTEKTLPHYFNATKYKSFQRNCECVQHTKRCGADVSVCSRR